jgi:tetratricopeptide (TPR) repeat protein
MLMALAATAADLGAAPDLPEYSTEEANKHIGESATVVGKVECVDRGRHHTDLQFGDCLPHTVFWVVVPDDVSGSEVNCRELRGVTVAVSGKIGASGNIPQMTVTSTSQIVARTKLNPDFSERVMSKEQQGDLDGAIAEMDCAIALAKDSYAYLQRASLKEKKGDLDGAIADFDEVIQRYPTDGGEYFPRSRLKMKKRDYDGAIADADNAIRLLSERTAPSVRAAAYSTRGEMKEAKEDFAGAAADYQMALNIVPSFTIYKTKLKHAQAEAARERPSLANSKSVYGDDRPTTGLSRTARPQAGSKQYANSDTADDAESPVALVTRAKLKIRSGDLDGAIEDCDRALQLSRGSSTEASRLRIQAMRAKTTAAGTQSEFRETSGSHQEQPVPGLPRGGELVPKPKSAEVVDVPPSLADRNITAGNIKVTFADGRAEQVTSGGNCIQPRVSAGGYVGWVHFSGLNQKGYALNEKLVIRFPDGTTKTFAPDSKVPFISAWSLVDHDSGVVMRSMSFHGPSSYIRYDLATGKMTNKKEGHNDDEPAPPWARAVAYQ